MKKKLQHIYNLLKKVKLKMQQVENKEAYILKENMPKWYSFYQYSLISRIIRVIAFLIVASTYYTSVINIILVKLNCNNMLNISTENYLSIYSFLFFLSLSFLILHFIFQMLIRIIFFKKIVKNSPVDFIQCVSTGFKICRYGFMGAGALLGIPGIDYVFEKNGHIPILRSFYLERQIKIFGANKINCALTEGEKFEKNGIISNSLRYLQERTEAKERLVNKAFDESLR